MFNSAPSGMAAPKVIIIEMEIRPLQAVAEFEDIGIFYPNKNVVRKVKIRRLKP